MEKDWKGNWKELWLLEKDWKGKSKDEKVIFPIFKELTNF